MVKLILAFLYLCFLLGCSHYEHTRVYHSDGSVTEYLYDSRPKPKKYTPFPEGRFKWVPGHPDCYKYGECGKKDQMK